MVCSPSELDTDGAILRRQDGRAPWARFHGSPTSKEGGIACFLDNLPRNLRRYLDGEPGTREAVCQFSTQRRLPNPVSPCEPNLHHSAHSPHTGSVRRILTRHL